MREYVKAFNVKDKSIKLMSIPIDDEKLLEKYKTIWTKIGDVKNFVLKGLPVHDINTVIMFILTFVV